MNSCRFLVLRSRLSGVVLVGTFGRRFDEITDFIFRANVAYC